MGLEKHFTHKTHCCRHCIVWYERATPANLDSEKSFKIETLLFFLRQLMVKQTFCHNIFGENETLKVLLIALINWAAYRLNYCVKGQYLEVHPQDTLFTGMGRDSPGMGTTNWVVNHPWMTWGMLSPVKISPHDYNIHRWHDLLILNG